MCKLRVCGLATLLVISGSILIIGGVIFDKGCDPSLGCERKFVTRNETVHSDNTFDKRNSAWAGFSLMMIGAVGLIIVTILLIIECVKNCKCTDDIVAEFEPRNIALEISNRAAEFELRNAVPDDRVYEISVPNIIIINVIPREESCPICLEEIDGECASFACLHLTHKTCMDRWMLEKRECPLCRHKN